MCGVWTRKQPTFGDGTTGFQAKCRLFSQAKKYQTSWESDLHLSLKQQSRGYLCLDGGGDVRVLQKLEL